ncbi:methyl-accepting chemotaxis protein [Pirellulaceae bacterium SH449]
MKISTRVAADDRKTKCPSQRALVIIDELTRAVKSAISEIRDINENAKLLALNARIEAARVGDAGSAFGVVTQEMQGLSTKTASVADKMETSTSPIKDLISVIGDNTRGERLADIALSNIDLVDRNLYERTCDVRWWATDSALVTALTTADEKDAKFASTRLGVILNAYTVYFDLVLCNSSGTVIANGRPGKYNSLGKSELASRWFSSAMNLRTGDEFVFDGPVDCQLVGNQPSLIYATAVRREGATHGSPLGALAVVFNWSSLSQAILNNPMWDQCTDRMFVDEEGKVLAASDNLPRDYVFPIRKYAELMSKPRGYTIEKLDGANVCIAQAKSPGFETYATGWRSVIIQRG